MKKRSDAHLIQEDNLFWVATTDTLNPDSVKDVAAAVRKDLEREGVVCASS